MGHPHAESRILPSSHLSASLVHAFGSQLASGEELIQFIYLFNFLPFVEQLAAPSDDLLCGVPLDSDCWMLFRLTAVCQHRYQLVTVDQSPGCFSGFVLWKFHCQDGTRRETYNGFGHTAYQHARQPASSVRSYDDHFHAFHVGNVDNLRRGFTCHQPMREAHVRVVRLDLTQQVVQTSIVWIARQTAKLGRGVGNVRLVYMKNEERRAGVAGQHGGVSKRRLAVFRKVCWHEDLFHVHRWFFHLS